MDIQKFDPICHAVDTLPGMEIIFIPKNKTVLIHIEEGINHFRMLELLKY